MSKPLILITVDGWGVAPDSDRNAVFQAKTPNFDRLVREYPVMTLYSSGGESGLMPGQAGNAIAGHLNIGAGRTVCEQGPRIDKSIADGSFYANQALLKAVQYAKEHKSDLHLIGAFDLSKKYASLNHLKAMVKLAHSGGIKRLFVHCVLPTSVAEKKNSPDVLKQINKVLKVKRDYRIGSVSGDFYALNSGKWWDRTEAVYRMLTGETEAQNSNALKFLKHALKDKDTKLDPTRICESTRKDCYIKQKDSVVFMNFKPSGIRQLTESLLLPGFNKFERKYLDQVFFVTMVEYEREIPALVAYPPQIIHNTLGESLARVGLSQLRLAEAPGYGSVTNYFSGHNEEPFEGESRMFVPSPEMDDYSGNPRMAAASIKKILSENIDKKSHDFYLVNFCNLRILEKSVDFGGCIQACQAIDKVIAHINDHVSAKNGTLVLVGSHSGAEKVRENICAEINTNPVPFFIINSDFRGRAGPSGDPPEGDLSLIQPAGTLADVGPTILKLLRIKQPAEMSGQSLV